MSHIIEPAVVPVTEVVAELIFTKLGTIVANVCVAVQVLAFAKFIDKVPFVFISVVPSTALVFTQFVPL